MKQAFLLFATIFALLITQPVMAETNIEFSNSRTAEVTIRTNELSEGEFFNVLVMPRDSDGNVVSVESKSISPAFVSYFEGTDAVTDEFVFNLNIDSVVDEAFFDVYVSTRDKSYELMYVNFDTVMGYAKTICTGSETDALYVLRNKSEAMQIDTDLFTHADVSRVYKLLKSGIVTDPIIFGTDGEQNKDELDIIALKKLREKIKLASLISCFELRQESIILNNNGEYLYDEIIPLNSLDDGSVTVNSLYEKSILTEYKKNVWTTMMGLTFNSEADVVQAYAKSVILNAIKYNQQTGFGYVSEALTLENVAKAGMNIPKYLALTNKTAANRTIVSASVKPNITYENIENQIEASVETDSGGGSSGDNGDSVISRPPSGGTLVSGSTQKPVEHGVQTVRFNDISGHWAKEWIESLVEKKIFSGYPDGTFGPDFSINREQVCKILVEGFKLEKGEETATFDDVDNDSWFKEYVDIMSSKGIVKGLGDSMFGVGVPVTREEFCVIVYRILGETKDSVNEDDIKEFVDEEFVSDWAKNAVKYLSSVGVLSGFDDGSFRPKSTISRAEAAKILCSLLTDEEG